MRPLHIALGLLWPALLGGCTDSGVIRKVTLTASPVLASGQSSVVEDSLRIYTSNLEPLSMSARYVAWAVTLEGSVALGELVNGTPLSLEPAALGLELSDIRSLEVTEEARGDVLPSAPSAKLRLQGQLGATLSYIPASTANLSLSSGSATLVDDQISVMMYKLTVLPSGLTYGVWGLFPKEDPVDSSSDDSADGMAMAETTTGSSRLAPNDAGHDGTSSINAVAANLTPYYLGSLDETGMLAVTSPKPLVQALGVLVTLESSAGEIAISPNSVAGGLITLPQTTSSTSDHTH